jgi:hypothetical protein
MSKRKFAHTPDGVFLRRLAMDPTTELMFTQRSGYEAEQQRIYRPDCLSAICVGRVINSEKNGPDWRRTVQGKDREGDTITIVVTVVTTNSGGKRIVVLDSLRNNESDEDKAAHHDNDKANSTTRSTDDDPAA